MFSSLLRSVGRDSFTLVSKDAEALSQPIYFYQSVRWSRKPRWLPTAKSKVFRIPERPQISVEEDEELKSLNNNYRTEIKSLRAFFAERIRASETGEEVIAEQERLEEEDFQKCLKLNDEWNKEVAVLRVARLAKEKEEELENIIKRIEENKILEEERRKEAQLMVQKEIERSKTFITPENIDEAIEKALSSTVEYDYAIDDEGTRYIGKNAKPLRSSPPLQSPPPPQELST